MAKLPDPHPIRNLRNNPQIGPFLRQHMLEIPDRDVLIRRMMVISEYLETEPEDEIHEQAMLNEALLIDSLTLDQFRHFLVLQETAHDDLPPGYDEYTYLTEVEQSRELGTKGGAK